MLDEKEKTYKVLESESAECRNVRIIKLSECAMSTFGIKPVMIAENEKAVSYTHLTLPTTPYV